MRGTAGFGPIRAVAAAFSLAILAVTGVAHAAEFSPSDKPMRFVVVRSNSPLCGEVCPEWISAEGTIERDTGNRLKAALKKIGKKRLPIVISSPGGDVDGAMATGRVIRANKLDVAVGLTYFGGCAPEEKGCKAEKEGGYRGSVTVWGAFCNSACSWVVAGGVRRLVGTAGYLGVHQITTTMVKETVTYKTEYRIVKGKKKAVNKKVVSRKRAGSYKTTKLGAKFRKDLRAYQKEMGIAAGFLDRSQSVPAADLLRLELSELRQHNLVTDWTDAGVLAGPGICRSVPLPENCRALPPPPPKTPQQLAAELVDGIEKSNPKIAKQMRFALARASSSRCEPLCPEWIVAEGRVTPEAPARLNKLLGDLGERKPPIVISSTGGKADAAMEIGRLIRKNGLTVVVGSASIMGCSPGAESCRPKDGKSAPTHVGSPSTGGSACIAECVLILAAGVERRAGVGSVLGWLATAVPSKKLSARIDAYLEEMGMPARILKEGVPAALTDWAQWRLVKMNLLTAPEGAEQVAEASSCPSTPDLCRQSQVKPRTAQVATAKVAADALLPARPVKDAMAFVYVRGSSPLCEPNCPEWISAEGTIDADAPYRFEKMLETVGGRRVPVILNSKGGDVVAAMELGRLIRKTGLDTSVAGTRFLPCAPAEPGCRPVDGGAYVGVAISSWGKCVAACPLVLAGGVRRLVGPGRSVVLQAVPPHDKLLAYAYEMGVDWQLVRQMQDVPYPKEVELEMDQMRALSLVTGRENVDELAAPALCRTFPKTDNCRLVDMTQ